MKHYIQRTEGSTTTSYPPASLQELKYWLNEVEKSGYLNQQEERGITFKIVEE
jgi:hypothetical protein